MSVAKQLGATHVVNFKDGDVVEQIMALTDGRGVDVPIEALGTQGTFESALRILRPGGRHSSLGFIPPTCAFRWALSLPVWATTASSRPCAPAAKNACGDYSVEPIATFRPNLRICLEREGHLQRHFTV
jgi:threonine dehydrogenase-like Zn-dependent dehydrogenase